MGEHLERELEVALEAARGARHIIRGHWAGGVAAEHKEDGEPVTAADREANAFILERIREAFPEDGILSEESPDDRSRLSKSRVWIVDPLDGTREFLQKSSDFAVHIALAEEGRPVLGVVDAVLWGQSYVARRDQGAALLLPDGKRELLRVSNRREPLRVVMSRFSKSSRMERMLQALGPHQRVLLGSAGLKAALLARGGCELYFSATDRMSEWDLCAPQIIVEEAGGICTDLGGGVLAYNQPDPRQRRGVLMAPRFLHGELLQRLLPLVQRLPWSHERPDNPPLSGSS